METALYLIAGFFIYVLGPIATATAIALVWRGFDELRCRIGLGKREELKFFGLYIFRGLLVTLVAIAAFAIFSRVNRGAGPDPMAKDSWTTYQQGLQGARENEKTPAKPAEKQEDNAAEPPEQQNTVEEKPTPPTSD